MKVHNIEQGTAEWHALRVGLPTASNFDRIVCPSDGKLSKRAKEYAIRLAAEIVLRRSLEEEKDDIYAIQRGRELEPQAILAYEFETSTTVHRTGFISDDDTTYGASPDGLIGHDGMVEIKCPLAHNHAFYMIQGFGTKYYAQVQGQLLVAEREWNDRVSYSDELPLHRERTYRDEKFLSALQIALKDFHEMKMEFVEKLRRVAAGTEDLQLEEMPA